METVWDYFELDGAYFRKRADSGLAAVDEVFWPLPDGWVSYVGERTLPDGRKVTIDSCRPFCFGSRIEKENLPVEAGGQGTRTRYDITYLTNLLLESPIAPPKRRKLPEGFREAGSVGEAFVITGASKPKP
jgi:hypothetical protein